MKFTVDIDCAPGAARPDTYIEGVIKDLGLTLADPVGKLFGNWTWAFETTEEHYQEIKPTLKERIESLYYSGAIRYGSW